MAVPKNLTGTGRRVLRPKSQTISHPPAPRGADRFQDALLVRQVQAGETQAFAELARRYQNRVYNACLRVCGHHEDARDLAQEAFLKAFAAIESFRGTSAFFTWIFRIAVNLSISHRRRMRATLSLDAPVGVDGGDGGAALSAMVADASAMDPADGPLHTERQALVAAALLELEDDYRAVVVLRDVADLSYQEIADVLETPVGTVKSRIFRARMALREALAKQGMGER